MNVLCGKLDNWNEIISELKILKNYTQKNIGIGKNKNDEIIWIVEKVRRRLKTDLLAKEK